MGVLNNSTVLLAVSFILGCSSGQGPDPHGPAAAPPAKTVFDPLTQDVRQARGVQDTVDANSESTRAAVDRAERGDSPP
jgi:hypothetical protein